MILYTCSFVCIILFHIGQSWHRSQACECKRDGLWVRSSLEEIKYLIFLYLRSGNERGTCLKVSRFPLPTLMYTGFSVKQNKILFAVARTCLLNN